VWVTDCFRAYDHRALADWSQQKCFAHFLRELGRLQREKKRGAGLLREALAWREEKGRLEPAGFEARLQKPGWPRSDGSRMGTMRVLPGDCARAVPPRRATGRSGPSDRRSGSATRPLEVPEPMQCGPACFKP
jgi:hypothetical protein